MELNKNIFRAYDIRGIVGEDLSPEIAFKIGYAFGTYLTELNPQKSLHILVGRDNRPHGKDLSEAFQKGLSAAGTTPFDLGESPSPFLYFAVTHGHFDGGVNVTASHNPVEYNGFKLVSENAHSVHGEEIQKIYQIAASAKISEDSVKGQPLEEDLISEYQKTLSEKIKLEKPVKVVVDSAGGVSTSIYSKTLQLSGAEVIELYPKADGNFPYHSPDPLVEDNLSELKQKVLSEKANIGLAFDGDGDRVLAITETGEFVDANKILVLLAKYLVKPGETVVHTVSSSSIVPEVVKKLGAIPMMVPVGHSFVHAKMHQTGAPLGGEQSGHFFIAKNYYEFDDALYTGLNLLALLSKSENSFSELVSQIPTRFSKPERRLPCPDDKKFEIIEKIKSHFSEKYPTETMDGARIDFGQGGWAGIRASNTSPCISVIAEAATPEHLEKIEQEVNSVLQTYPDVKI